MIEEPPLLQIWQPAHCPSADRIAAIGAYPTGILCDAMDGRGAFDAAMAPLDPGALAVGFCGVALTVETGPDDILGLLAATAEVQPGDVVVTATGAWRGSAAIGDRLLGMLRNGGAAAFVTDGMVRDLEGIIEVGLPVVCAGLTPNSPSAKGPGKVGAPVDLGGMRVCSGDVIVGDRSGTVVVPFAQIDAVIARAAHIVGLETELDAKVAAGLTTPDAILALLASDQTARR